VRQRQRPHVLSRPEPASEVNRIGRLARVGDDKHLVAKIAGVPRRRFERMGRERSAQTSVVAPSSSSLASRSAPTKALVALRTMMISPSGGGTASARAEAGVIGCRPTWANGRPSARR
jgi:hypothetical protein